MIVRHCDYVGYVIIIRSRCMHPSCYPFIELCAVSQRRSVPTTSGARDILSRPSPLSRERAASESVSVPYVDDRDKSFICGVESGYVIQVGVVMVHSINLCLKIGIQTLNWDLCFERASTCSVYSVGQRFFSLIRTFDSSWITIAFGKINKDHTI